MSKLIQIQQDILGTNEAMAHVERALTQDINSTALKLTFDSLSKRLHELESEFRIEADNLGAEVCSYRVFGESETPNIKDLASVLSGFQDLISVVFDAVKYGSTRQRARISPEIFDMTQLSFGYTFPGSVGIVLTMPRQMMLFGETELDQSIGLISEMAMLKEPEEVQRYSKRLGSATIRALYKWVSGHSDSGLGVDIKWRRREVIRKEFFAQKPEFRKLKDTIGMTSDELVEENSMLGTLVGVDVQNKSFRFKLDNGDHIRGKLSEAIGEEFTYNLPKRYNVRIKKTTTIKYSTEEEITHYQLLQLDILE